MCHQAGIDVDSVSMSSGSSGTTSVGATSRTASSSSASTGFHVTASRVLPLPVVFPLSASVSFR